MLLHRHRKEKPHLTNPKPLQDKNIQQNKNRRELLQPSRGICEKSTSDIMLNGGRLKVFSIISGTGQPCLVSPLLHSILLEALARAIRQQEEIEGI